MRRALFVLLLMVGMVVGGIQVVAAASDQFLVLDPYDPRGINDRGDIVGLYQDANFEIHGVLLANGTVTVIDAPAAACNIPQPGGRPFRPSLFALGINNHGQVVGSYTTSVIAQTGCQRVTHGFLWANGTLTAIDSPDGRELALTGINDSGDIVGFVLENGIQGGVLISKGTFTLLANPPGSQDIPAPFGINNQGDIVGDLGGDIFLLSKGEYTVFRVPGTPETEGRGINDRGEIAGFFMNADGSIHGYLFSHGSFTFFDAPGASLTYVYGFNNLDQVVGGYVDANGAGHGFEMKVSADPDAPYPASTIITGPQW